MNSSEPDFVILGERSEHGTKKYPIRPQDVPMNGGSTVGSTFGTAEVESVAGKLLQFFKKKGYWSEFTLEELRQFYLDNKWDPNTMLYGLMGTYVHYGNFLQVYDRGNAPLLVTEPTGKLFVTNNFVDKCAKKATSSAA